MLIDRRIVVVGVVAALLAAAGAAFAGKPSDGGSTGGGAVYFEYGRVETWAMNSAGSAKAALPVGRSADRHGSIEPSYALHGGQRWFLKVATVVGTNPDGTARGEVFAVRGDGAVEVQLTSGASVSPLFCRWAKNDSFVSFSGVEWTGPGPDDAVSRVFSAPVVFDAGGTPGVTSAFVAILTSGFVVDPFNGALQPDIGFFDWSPSGDRIAWGALKVTTVATGVTVLVADVGTNNVALGCLAEWSPNGAQIAFDGKITGIETIDPSGANRRQVVRDGFRFTVSRPHWSPTASHLVYQQLGSSLHFDVYRATASGGSKTNLTPETESLSDNAVPVAWR